MTLFHRLLFVLLCCSLPIAAAAQSQYNIYFGDYHTHTWYSDGNTDQNKATYTQPVRRAIEYARTSPSMNYLGISDHNHSMAGMSMSNWNAGVAEAAAANQDGVFVGLFGQEWGTINGGGHALIYGTDKLFGWESGNYNVLVSQSNYTMLWDSVKKHGGFVSLAHPQSGDYGNIFSSPYNAAADSVIVGIAIKSGPSTSSSTTESDPSSSNYESKYHDLLRLGYHIAPAGHQDNHKTNFGRSNQQRTGLLATSLTKANILDALRNRRSYCTEDHNLQLRFESGAHVQGEIFNTSDSVRLRVKVTDPDGTVSSIVIRYGIPGSGSAPVTLTSVSGRDSLIHTLAQANLSTYYYYAYVTMADGKRAWSAPMWITKTTSSAPAAFNLLLPANSSTGRPLSDTLSWQSSVGATGYDVYLDVVNPPTALVSSNQAGASYIASLLPNKTYYWKVVSRNGSGTTTATGAPWNFATIKPVFGTTPGSLAFGSVYIGASKRDSVTVSNTGTYALVIDSVKSDNARFSVSPGAATVAAGGSQKYYITFAPTVTTSQNGNIRFYHNGTGSPSAVSVSGAGTQLQITATTTAGGTIAPSGTVNVSYGGSQAFTITPSAGYHVDSLRVDGVNAGALTGYTFSNVTANHTITPYFSINRYSITSSASANGSITPLGTQSVAHGDSIVFAIAPNGGYAISDVVVDGSSVGAVSSYTFRTVTAAHTITASFAPPGSYTVTATAGAGGTVVPNGPTVVPSGQDLSFTITASAGYHIDSVFVDGAHMGVLSSYTFTNVTANHTIRAVFGINTYTITVSAGANGTVSPSGAFTVNHGVDTTITFNPAPGYGVDSVFVDNAYIGAPLSYTITAVAASHTVSVKFKILVHTITTSVTGGGVISPAGPVSLTHGGDTTFTITPAEGYYLASLTVDGQPEEPVTSFSFTNVGGNHTIAATFAINIYSIVSSAGEHGTIEPLGSHQYPYGTDTAYAIVPETGYDIASLVVDGINQPVAPSYAFDNLNASHTIHATFSISEYVMAVTIDGGGVVMRNPEQDFYTYGTQVEITALPLPGYRFAGWSEDVVSSSPTVTLTMDGPKQLTALFEPIPVFSVAGTTIDFEYVVLHDQKTLPLIIHNTGAAALEISSISTGTTEFTVTPSVGVIPAGDSLLVEVSFTPESEGLRTDTVTMVHNADGSPQKIVLSGTGTYALVSVSYNAKWNLVSNPLILPSDSIWAVYPASMLPYGYSFNASVGYLPEVELERGKGYWAKFFAAGTTSLSGLSVMRDTVSVQAGWNLIGSISTAIPAGAIQASGTAILSNVFGYNNGYAAADSIRPGKAYWVRVSDAGELILEAPAFGKAPAMTVNAAAAIPYGAMTRFTLADAEGSSQDLFLANGATVDAASGRYDLPPMPPQGVFDARFSSQRQIEEYASSGDGNYRIDIASPQYPVTLSIVPAPDMQQSIIVKDPAGNVLVRTAPGASADVRVDNPEITYLTVSTVTIPREFALLQNYPNPFNPVSTIGFDLPMDCRVVLRVYDLLGREVQTLINGDVREAGRHQVEFNGSALASGIYLYRIDAAGTGNGTAAYSSVKKMLLVK